MINEIKMEDHAHFAQIMKLSKFKELKNFIRIEIISQKF